MLIVSHNRDQTQLCLLGANSRVTGKRPNIHRYLIAKITESGGVFFSDDRTTNSDDNITEWILDRCKPLAPELLNKHGQFDIIAFQVGHRPSRKGGPRVEVEWLDIEKEPRKFICHNYGHGSSG
jgi:hypothetical protein